MQYRNIIWLALAAVLVAVPVFAADDEGDGLTGSVEVIYREIGLDGSDQKYDEDFDGLDSGVRLDSLVLDWQASDDGWLDYASLNLAGLGGDPFERSSLRLGRRGAFDLRVRDTRQAYLYDLFEIENDEDGATWNANRRRTSINLDVYAGSKTKLVFGFEQVQRDGDSLFLKDISRDLFRFETPFDQAMKRYTVGGDFRVGPVDLVVRQTLRRYDNRFENFTEGNLGVSLTDNTLLYHYDWRQFDRGGSDFTTVRLRAPLGKRVALTVGLFGTLLGEEEIKSDIAVEQLGVAFNGFEFGGSCAATGSRCSTDATCDAVTPGDVCVADLGTSRVDLDGDTTMIDADLAIRVADPATLHLSFRSVDRDLDGNGLRDLDGDGFFEDVTGDGNDPSVTRLDTSTESLSAIVDVRPNRKLRLRAGLRSVDREVIREGFGSVRDMDFKSDGDETLLFGVTFRPAPWVRLHADYEDGDISQGFTNISATEREHARLRAVFSPQGKMDFGVQFLDFENVASLPSGEHAAEGTNWAAWFFHQANERLRYRLRYAEQDIETQTGIVFDTAGFGAVEAGDSLFATDNSQLSLWIDCTFQADWRLTVRGSLVEAEGASTVLGDTSGLVNLAAINQDFTDWEIGLSRDLASGVFLGGSVRGVDFDDVNDLQDYDVTMLILRAGMRF